MRLVHGGEALERVAVALAQGFASGDDTVGSGFTADLCDYNFPESVYSR